MQSKKERQNKGEKPSQNREKGKRKKREKRDKLKQKWGRGRTGAGRIEEKIRLICFPGQAGKPNLFGEVYHCRVGTN